jgi:hypothetical protein
MDYDEPHPAPNEKTQPIQWTERPTGALVAAGSLWPELPCPQLIFPSKTWFFGIYLNFQGQKSLKNNISHILNPNLTK